jgi:hypothetical protein
MKPDFGAIAAQGMIDGLLGLLSQPIVIVSLVAMILIAVVTRRLGRRPSDRRRNRHSRGRR